MNFDYRLIIDLSVISNPYDSRLEATKHLDGNWQLEIIYKPKKESEINATLNSTPSKILEELNKKIQDNNRGIEKLKDNLEFLIQQLNR
ncbi:hypothetical protein COV11_03840 [Candidatus Woesearchaeota archaeon CG10_big_fil_rev_8_21_14_0_10_30_7]|nr:MAG: hypothetical protein COV11_03840 [Candidatus Woesearchaeota archaeon CG10_big_fil_rev_8_21_14_0_10_30_7]